MDFFAESVKVHLRHRGKWEIKPKLPLQSRNDLSIAYTPGVAAVCERIKAHPSEVYELTMKGNAVAIVSDGSAVLGLGNIGAEAGLPVMEGKAILFKKFAGIDGVPLVINAHTVEEITAVVKAIAPTFGGINLEDIQAPKCFEIEAALQDIGIPVFHDDQHGTAIVLMAAMLNASQILGKPLEEMKVVINGAGAAGIAIARLLSCVGHDSGRCTPVKDVILCDTHGIISKERKDLNAFKQQLLSFSNTSNLSGTLRDALVGADCFIGVSKGNLLHQADIRSMAPDPIILAMANPIPEIMPAEAKAGGARIIGTGRSDFPNQVNNVLAFPGVFRGALDAKAKRITESMKIAAAFALARAVEQPNEDHILPDPLDLSIPGIVAAAVREAALLEVGVCA